MAVIDAQGLWLTPDRLELPIQAIAGADAIGRLAERYRLIQVWLHASALRPLGFDGEPGDAWQPLRRGDWRYTLVVPAWHSAHQLAPCWTAPADGPALLTEIERYAAAVGTLWHNTGALSNDWLLRDLWRRGALPFPRRTQLPEIAQRLEHDFFWHRRAGEEERAALWCHAFDRNAAYLAAGSGLPCAVGEPHHVDSPAFDKRRAALWLIRRPELPAGWPDPFNPQRRPNRPATVWVTTPTAELAAQLDPDFQPLEAWMWDESDTHGYLTPWYKALRAARLELLPRDSGAAYDALQLTYKLGVGRLGGTARKQGRDDPLCQPVWRWAVVARCRANLYRKLVKAGQAPVAVHTDCTWFLSDEPDPTVLADRLGLVLGDGLGEFTVEMTAPGPAAVAALDLSRTRKVMAALSDAAR